MVPKYQETFNSTRTGTPFKLMNYASHVYPGGITTAQILAQPDASWSGSIVMQKSGDGKATSDGTKLWTTIGTWSGIIDVTVICSSPDWDYRFDVTRTAGSILITGL